MYYSNAGTVPEAIVLHDADSLDFLGAAGAARILALTGDAKPDVQGALKTLRSFVTDIPPRLITRTAKRMGDERARELAAFLDRLRAAFAAGELRFSGALATLADAGAFADRLKVLRGAEWVVYAKRPFAGPGQVLAYLGRYTHRVAIANSRLVGLTEGRVSFTCKDYRDGGKAKVVTLAADEFIRRFLLHAVPDGFHRIRHVGFLANSHRAARLALCRSLLAASEPELSAVDETAQEAADRPLGDAFATCPACGGLMRKRSPIAPRTPPRQPFWCDSS